MRSQLFVLASLLALLVALFSQGMDAQVATITESKQIFRTYPFSDPDPVARMGNIYPYFRFEGYSITPIEREWKIVTLENPYIKLLIAPEMGGKVLGAFEKSTGKAFIYFNKVIKFREIAMRGPWTSGGLEFNFGDIGHTPTTATPVDYLTRTNEDGSVSCIIGAMDLASRTEWRVEIRLPKDRAYFETRSFWYNPTDVNTSLYHWMCVAEDADEDLQFLYPGTAYIGHGGEASPWPLDNAGRNLSLYHDNAFGSSKSYHVLGTYTDYFGSYWKNDDFGAVHWSRYGDKVGKKIWIWARSREGEIWKDLLTDPELGNKQYVEIQSGLLFNQAAAGSGRTPFKHMFFAPLSAERFDEAWFPFNKIGGIVEANLSGSLNVKREGKSITVGFCPVRPINEEIAVSVGGKEVHRKALNLKPLQSVVETVEAPVDGEIQVSVGDHISYRSGDDEAKILHRPIVANKEFDWNSVAGLYTDGVERARQRDSKGALVKFLACLSKDPVYTPSLVGASEIYYKRMQYDSAFHYVSKALANDAYDPDANFLYGVISRKLGRLYDAQDGFGVAARSMKYRPAANVQLAEIAFVRGRLPEADEYARRALDYDRYNVRAHRILALSCRKLGRLEDAKIVLERMLQIDPLSHFANFEHYLLDPSSERLHRFTSMIRNEFPHETYLELASYYLSLGLDREAISLLEKAPEHPIVSYWLAFFYDRVKDQGKSSEHLAKASQHSPHLVYPFRAETAEILSWAEARMPSWKTKYYLGLIFWSRDRLDIAQKYFAACGDVPDFAPFYLSRGRIIKSEKPASALGDYRRAYDLAKDDWRTSRTLIEHYNEQGEHAQALEIARAAVSRMPERSVLQLGYARTLMFNRRFGSSLSILDTITILPFEGAQYGREIYRQVCLLSAADAVKKGEYENALELISKARQWPERLGVGKPYEVDNRLEDYLEALCNLELGNRTQSNALLGQVVRYTQDHEGDWGSNRFIGALALRVLGRNAEARSLIIDWTKRDPKSSIAQWCSAVFAKDYNNARRIEAQLRKGFRGSILAKASVDGNFALLLELNGIQRF